MLLLTELNEKIKEYDNLVEFLYSYNRTKKIRFYSEEDFEIMQT